MDRDDYRRQPIRERPFSLNPRADGTYACDLCGDTGWVEVLGLDVHNVSVHACPSCRPEAYRAWLNGYERNVDPAPRTRAPLSRAS